MGFEESLIRNAAPTLAGLKVGSLYNFTFSNEKECDEAIDTFNLRLNPKGIFIELMKHDGDFYLIYVYRKTQLNSLLSTENIRDFLKEYGYDIGLGMRASDGIEILKERIGTYTCFPHEIGVFLGYPLEDVREFIDRKGEGYSFYGEWKVYHDEQEAGCFFLKLRKCREVYLKTYRKGRSLYDMTVRS